MSEKSLTLLEHIDELRRRLVRSVIAVIATTVISLVFADRIFDILILDEFKGKLIALELTENIAVWAKVGITGGIILAMPYLVYEFVMFVAPALTPKEKRHVYLVLPWVALMFFGGVIFGYFVLLPPGIGFLFNFGSDIANPQIRIGNYISVVTKLLLAIGIVFEMPVVTTFLAKLGVVSSQWLASKRKPAVILAFVIAAFITPTFDPLNQTFVAVPLIILYEMGIWLAKLVQPKKAPHPATAME
ncbi:MAG: twin-arginine translocase subunit TatC [Chloroflexi bacterium]|nr:twin-arginine translocase subunit TatC [Chloroflexota bacterium]